MDTFKTYTTLFGLDEQFTIDELSNAYRTLAMLYHPDISRDANALQKMQLINTAYDYLKNFVDSSIKADSTKEYEKIDEIYSLYKKAFTILQNSFYGYYSDGSGFTGDAKYLKNELIKAKELFATIIKDYPYNQWVDDAIDKINSINKWVQ